MKNRNIPDELKNWYRELPESQKSDMLDIWDASRIPQKSSENITANAQEIEYELQRALKRIDNKEKSIFSNIYSLRSNTRIIKWAAVALLLICTGIVWQLFSGPYIIEAPYGEIITVTLPDESTVELNSGAKLTFDRSFGNETRRVILEGEGYFDIRNNNQPFTVETHNALINVLGTRFNVRSWPTDINGETFVVLDQGNVEFTSRTLPEEFVSLETGQFSRVSYLNEEPEQPSPAPMDIALAWRSKGIALNNQPLPVIFNELERRFGTTIEITSPEIAERSASIYIREPESLESVLLTVSHATGTKSFDFEKSAGGYKVFNQ